MDKQQVLQQALGLVAAQLEKQIDDEINHLDNLGDEDIAVLRQKRMAELRKKQEKTKEWLAKGHGEYSEVLDEKQFFDVMKGEERMICHFYRDNWPCKVGANRPDVRGCSITPLRRSWTSTWAS